MSSWNLIMPCLLQKQTRALVHACSESEACSVMALWLSSADDSCLGRPRWGAVRSNLVLNHFVGVASSHANLQSASTCSDMCQPAGTDDADEVLTNMHCQSDTMLLSDDLLASHDLRAACSAAKCIQTRSTMTCWINGQTRPSMEL